MDANTKAADSGLKDLSAEASQNSQVSIPQSYYQQNSFKNLSNDNGPILLFDDARSFGATDWYGNPAWYITLNSATSKTDGYYSAAWFSTSTSSAIDFAQAGTKVVDWAYNHKTDNLYVLTDTQYLIIVSSKTGTVVSTNKVNNNVNKIQIIDFNSSVYLWNSKDKTGKFYSVEPQTGKLSNTNGNTSTHLSNKHLYGLIPLDVNYTIAVTSTSEPSDTDSSISLSLDFVDDNLNKITGSPTENISLSSTKLSSIYINGFKRNSDYVIFIKNKIYSVSLNKSLMSNSSFTNLLDNSKNPALGNFSLTSGSDDINSAFLDANGQIYFKATNSENINTLSVSNGFITMQIPTGLNTTFASNAEKAKKTQIFPVANSSTSEDVISRAFTGYVLSWDGFIGTGFLNGSVLSQRMTSLSSAPIFNVSNAGNSSIPSSVNTTNIAKGSSNLSNVTLENSNATLIADDIAGTLYVRVPYTITGSWYGNGSISSEFNSRGFLIGKFTFRQIQQATTWVTNLPDVVKRLEPNQISPELLKRYATSIITIPSSVLALQNSNLNIDFVITSKNSGNGTIKLMATITYKNAYGSIVSYKMSQEKEYSVKKEAASYAFAFAGQTTADQNKVDKSSLDISTLLTQAKDSVTTTSDNFLTVDVGTLQGDLAQYANVLPSLWNPNVVNDSFITTKDKYPNNPTITLFPDDDGGNIIIVVKYDNLAATTASKFAIRYTGITSYAKSTVKFQGNKKSDLTRPNGQPAFPQEQDNILDITTVSGFGEYGAKLVSDITPSELSNLYNSPLISSMGFTPKVTFAQDETSGTEGTTTYDSEYGSFLLKIDFTESVSSNLRNAKDEFVPFSDTPFKDKMGLSNGVIYQRYAGLLPIGSTYNISIDRNSTSYRSLIANNNVNAALTSTDILSILTINGYDSSQGDTITIFNYRWNGEVFEFQIFAKSKTYESISTTQTFGVSWSPKFASVRNMSLSVAVITSIVGITLVSLGVAFYIIRRNKIRKLLK
ncbi:conserved hypothetical protein [Malacoplasma penetrans HF-2]|uniref:Lipoprotein n=1 Tax=Malacoplasma penetrans (strain HF-2) TaxID=272633 RepID=Q8EUZ4_MALP2|nr:conserved hypothetical protein [Malacoplasma penetrans HF-2]